LGQRRHGQQGKIEEDLPGQRVNDRVENRDDRGAEARFPIEQAFSDLGNGRQEDGQKEKVRQGQNVERIAEQQARRNGGPVKEGRPVWRDGEDLRQRKPQGGAEQPEIAEAMIGMDGLVPGGRQGVPQEPEKVVDRMKDPRRGQQHSRIFPFQVSEDCCDHHHAGARTFADPNFPYSRRPARPTTGRAYSCMPTRRSASAGVPDGTGRSRSRSPGEPGTAGVPAHGGSSARSATRGRRGTHNRPP